jgi:hypothetical protein
MILGRPGPFLNYSTYVVNETSQKPALRGEILTGLGAESPTKPPFRLKKSNFLRNTNVKECEIIASKSVWVGLVCYSL